MNMITTTVGRPSHIARKARRAADLAALREENNIRHARKEAARIKLAKTEGVIWHNTPRIKK